MRLGGFHMCMSFPGSHEAIIQWSEILSIFEKSYAGLGAILSGKELSWGTRPHTLLYRKLMGLIIWTVFILNREMIFQSECLNLPSKVQELKDMVSQFMSKDISENKLKNSRPFLDVR